MVAATRTSTAWERYAWVAGIVFVVAIVAEILRREDAVPNAAPSLKVDRDAIDRATELRELAPGEGNPRSRSPPPLLWL
jgi:hypothetical protein